MLVAETGSVEANLGSTDFVELFELSVVGFMCAVIVVAVAVD